MFSDVYDLYSSLNRKSVEQKRRDAIRTFSTGQTEEKTYGVFPECGAAQSRRVHTAIR